MSETIQLGLPLMEASQAQKHITHNEAIILLDAAVQLSVKSRSWTSPPSTPQPGDRFIIPAAAAGPWLNKERNLAVYEAGIWHFLPVKTGWRLWIEDEAAFLLFDGTAWRNLTVPVLQNLSSLGINTTADSYNKLSVSSSAVLLTHDGNDQRLTVNKNLSTNTGSVVFQTGFSGRAEFGLTGDDNFHMKVSADGAAWHEAIHIDRSTGIVTLTPNSVKNSALADMPANSIKGRATSGAGEPQDLTPPQITELLTIFSESQKGLVPASAGGTDRFLRADGQWASPSSAPAILSASMITASANSLDTTGNINSWGHRLAAPLAMP